ncbi:hypothetical protein B0J13DRAFT_572214 [Dactylonectria estremocensis]|uniref:Uncharacterized protein n=1 Tax=Dactylonectria estremocensis TaxID=1079267 RepID=A0A9P9IBM3_9HYPO|nr:hypothetical protein B0J13DRAFT_572214 [Dactylonectria estremocensis]
MSAPSLGPVPEHLRTGTTTRGDLMAKQILAMIDADITRARRSYGRGTWGYTVLRTVYTPDSDRLFPEAMDHLKRWVLFYIDRGRFSCFGERGNEVMAENPERVNEVIRRLHLDVIEDRENLDVGPLSFNSPEAFYQLEKYYRQTMNAVREEVESAETGRFSDCLIVDAKSLASLQILFRNPPVPRNPDTLEELQQLKKAGRGSWLWLLDSKNTRRHHAGAVVDGLDESAVGFMKIETGMIHQAWYARSMSWSRYEFFLPTKTHENGEVYLDYW